MCKCQSQEQQVADLRKLVNEIVKLEQGAPDVAGISGDANWETQSVCSDVSGVSEDDVTLYLLDNHVPFFGNVAVFDSVSFFANVPFPLCCHY